MEEPDIPPTIFIKHTDRLEKLEQLEKHTVLYNIQGEKAKFTTLNKDFNVNASGSLFFKDILVIKNHILVEFYKKNVDNGVKLFKQTLKVCKSCNLYFYNNSSHKDEQHKGIAEIMYLISSNKKNTNPHLQFVIQDQIGLTEYARYNENNHYLIFSESEHARTITLRIINRSSESITLIQGIADNSHNGFITWTGGRQLGELQIYQFDELVTPGNQSARTIQINLPGQFPASKDLSLKIKTIDNRTNEENLFDLELTVFNNYLPPRNEETLEPRIHKQWICQKYDRNDTENNLNTKHSHLPPKTLFKSLSVYQTLDNKLLNHPITIPVTEQSLNLPNEVLQIYRILHTTTNRENWKVKAIHYIKSELVHYMMYDLNTYITKVIKINKQGLITELVLDLDLYTLSNLHLKTNEEALVKIQGRILRSRISISEVKQTTIEIEAITDVPLNSTIQIAPTLRSAPFSIVCKALEDADNLEVGLIAKNYFLPNKIRTKNTSSNIEFADKSLDDCQREAVTKMNNLAPGDVFVLQGPPGTGKTRTLLEFVHQRLLSKETVLLVCPTNSAVVDIFGKMKKSEILKDKKILKITNPSSKVERTCETYCNLLTDGDMRHKLPHPKQVHDAEVIICTIIMSHRLNDINCVTPTTDPNHKGWAKTFENLIVDEAAFCPESLILVPIIRQITGGKKMFRLILSGDPLQLTQNPRSIIIPPQEDIMTRCLKFLSNHKTNYHFLRQNYRSAALIVELLNELSYKGQLVCNSMDKGEITVIHTETSKISLQGSKSKSSLPEASTAIRYIKNQPGNEKHTVLSYYRNQKNTVLAEAEKQTCHNIHSTTIENIQGQESNSIVLNTVLPSVHNPWQRSQQRINVVISRCITKLTVVGDLLELQRHTLFKHLIKKSTKIIAPEGIKRKLSMYQEQERPTKKKKVI